MQGQSTQRVLTELLLTDYVSRTAPHPGCAQPRSLGEGGPGCHEAGRQCHRRPMKRGTPLYTSSHLILSHLREEPSARLYRCALGGPQHSSRAWITEPELVGVGQTRLAPAHPLFLSPNTLTRLRI